MRHSIACSADLDVLLADPERLARGHAQLFLNEIDARHQLGDGVLHLDPRVDLDEVEVPCPSTRNSTVPALW